MWRGKAKIRWFEKTILGEQIEIKTRIHSTSAIEFSAQNHKEKVLLKARTFHHVIWNSFKSFYKTTSVFVNVSISNPDSTKQEPSIKR